jgi:hypothetical protein
MTSETNGQAGIIRTERGLTIAGTRIENRWQSFPKRLLTLNFDKID